MEETRSYDVIIIGGSYAGLSAAMALGRSLRKVLVIDAGQPCNRQTPHSHNFLTQDGETPFGIARKAKEQVLKYSTVSFVNAIAVKGKKTEDHFSIQVQDGTSFNAKKLLFATGVKDILPNIDGLSDCWGISVLHCPYCHGFEVRHETIGILGNGDPGFELCKLIHNWSKDLTLFTNGKSTLTAEQFNIIRAHNIRVVEKEISSVEHEKGYVKSVVFKDGTKENIKAMFARGTFELHCQIPIEMGCNLTEQGYIKVDDFQRTSVNGVYAAGDNTLMFRAVSIAVAAGTKAGAVINKELIDETFL